MEGENFKSFMRPRTDFFNFLYMFYDSFVRAVCSTCTALSKVYDLISLSCSLKPH